MAKEKETRSRTEADWEVRLLPAAGGSDMGDELIVRAATVSYDRDWVTLRDGKSRVVFSSGSVRFVRRADAAAVERQRADNVIADEISMIEHDGENGTLRVRVLCSLPPAKIPEALGRYIADLVKGECYPPEES